jgi:CO/xanthine dehydrogenase Mo-binding subunit
MTRATTKALASREYYNTREAAIRMRVSADKIRAAVEAGELRAKNSTRVTDENPDARGGKLLFSGEALDAWFDGLEDA